MWLRKGGLVDALHCMKAHGGRPSTVSLLHAAAANGHLDIVKMLLKRGASVDLPNDFGVAALMNAAGGGHPSILLALLQHSANPYLQSSIGITALMGAAGHGQEACVQALLRAKANPDLQDNEGRTALMWAAHGGHEACMQAMLRAKVNTELRTKDGRTALQQAEIYGHTTIAALIRQHAAPLLPAAAAPTASPDTGEPTVSSPVSLPLEIFVSALRGELQEVIKWLRMGGLADEICSAMEDMSLLHAATSQGHLEIVKELLTRGASVDLPISGLTALMDAVYYGHPPFVRVLLQHSATLIYSPTAAAPP